MTRRYLLKKIKLSESDMKEIQESVQKAEESTTGEIALALTAESDTYSFWELLSATYFAGVVFTCLLPFANEIKALYEKFFWTISDWVLPAFYGITTLVAIIIGFFLMNIPFFDRLIIPHPIKKKSVTARAFRHFAESGIYETQEHSGILIFVSYLEREVRIIADSGIAKRFHRIYGTLLQTTLQAELKREKQKTDLSPQLINAVHFLQNIFLQRKKIQMNSQMDLLF